MRAFDIINSEARRLLQKNRDIERLNANAAIMCLLWVMAEKINTALERIENKGVK